MLFHIPIVLAAICDIAPTQAITTNETINPYSTAVAPRLSRVIFRKNRIIFLVLRLCYLVPE
jgi:hypothetical protein